ncbi:MAG: alpha/beta hydrolase, partial [Zetaproteobacteria bacterium]
MTERPTAVLIHGLFGFRKLLWLEYFNGVRPLLTSMGLRVLVPRLAWAGTIEQRACQLAHQLASETGPLHLIAHSMGGLDARAYITKLNGHQRVASLTTLATPHHGSEAADHVCRTLSPFALFPGVRVLTRGRVALFNARTPDHCSVIYRSYSAARPVKEHPWLVRRYGRIIQQAEGDN